MPLPTLVVHKAVGHATGTDNLNIFNDVQTIGQWPAHLHIKKVAKITVSADSTSGVNGIEITYHTSTGDRTIPHGKVALGDRDKNSRALTGDEFFVGFFGTVDNNNDTPNLRSIGFLVYNKALGTITSFGPFPSTSKPSNASDSVKGFKSLGLIAGFSGTVGVNGNLDTLAIYKVLSEDQDVLPVEL